MTTAVKCTITITERPARANRIRARSAINTVDRGPQGRDNRGPQGRDCGPRQLRPEDGYLQLVSIYKHHKLPRRGLGRKPKMDFMHIWDQKKAIWNTFFSINWFGHGVLENQIQALSRTLRRRFKDFQGPCLFSRTFQALKIWKKNQGLQALSRTHKSPVCMKQLRWRPHWSSKYVNMTNVLIVCPNAWHG